MVPPPSPLVEGGSPAPPPRPADRPEGDGVSKDSRTIQTMFGRVARRYDLLNHLLSASLDRLWRRRAVRALDLPAGSRALDLCCGTGDQAIALQRRGARVISGDFCLPMLAVARAKYGRLAAPRPLAVCADAQRLPWSDAAFDGATVSFGLRNVADLDAAIAELARVLRPGGRLAVLEFALPQGQPLRALYLLYFRRILPAIGRWISHHPSAYSYLPASVTEFPQRAQLLARLTAAGFERGRSRDLAAGVVCLYTAERGTANG